MYSDILVVNEQLIDAVLAGDPAAQLRLIELSEKYVYGALHKFDGLAADDINDLFQTVFLKLFDDDMRRIRMWNRDARFTTYLYRIVINLVKDFLGSSAFRTGKSLLEDDEEGHSPLENLTSDDSLDPSADIITLKYALNQLKPRERRMIELYYFQDMKEREIAALLDMPLNTVSSLKNRTIKKLRIILKEIEL